MVHQPTSALIASRTQTPAINNIPPSSGEPGPGMTAATPTDVGDPGQVQCAVARSQAQ